MRCCRGVEERSGFDVPLRCPPGRAFKVCVLQGVGFQLPALACLTLCTEHALEVAGIKGLLPAESEREASRLLWKTELSPLSRLAKKC